MYPQVYTVCLLIVDKLQSAICETKLLQITAFSVGITILNLSII